MDTNQIDMAHGPVARPMAEAPAQRATTTLLTRHEGGYAAQGPGFYVWDRDVAEVIRVAEALQAGLFNGSRTARFLVIEPGHSPDA